MFDEFYENELNREDLKDYTKNVVRWSHINGRIRATCKWSARLYNDYPSEREATQLFSPQFLAGNNNELKWEIQLDYKTDGYFHARLNFVDLGKTQYDYRFFILEKSLKLKTFNDQFNIVPLNTQQTKTTCLRYHYEDYLRAGKTTLVIIVGIVAEPAIPHRIARTSLETPMKPPVLEQKQENSVKMLPKLIQDLERLLEDRQFSDVTLIVEGEKLTAHKNVLAARSPIFYGMFAGGSETGLRKHDIEIEIDDAYYDTVKDMLKFVYTGELRELDEEAAKKLLVTAHKYAIEDLHTRCQETLCKFLNTGNAVEILNLADSCDAKMVKEECVNIITSDVQNIDECKLLPLRSELLVKILVGVSKKNNSCSACRMYCDGI